MGRAVTVTDCSLDPCAMASGMRYADLSYLQVNSEALENAQRQLAASYGPVTAADCMLVRAGGATLDCGASQKLTVHPKHLQHGRLRVMHLSSQFTNPMAGRNLLNLFILEMLRLDLRVCRNRCCGSSSSQDLAVQVAK